MGPLNGYRIIELAGLGPGPMGAMMLGDMGADVIRVDRIVAHELDRFSTPKYDVHGRSRRSIALDLRSPEGKECFLKLVETADGVIEPFRPGVAERLGIGPDPCLERNPRLNYLRITGWGQTGPLAKVAGHDLNYIALTGLAGCIGPEGQKPVPPLNLVGDYGGGGMLVAFGMVAALLETARSGKGQTIDAAMTEGASLLFGSVLAMQQAGMWQPKGQNQIDGGAPYYQMYETSDGKYVSVGAIERKFFQQLADIVGIDPGDVKSQYDVATWPESRAKLERIFRARTRAQWCELLEGTDVCFAPVLEIEEAPHHPHAKARNSYVDIDGALHPAPAPRYSRTEGKAFSAPVRGQHTAEVLAEIGMTGPTADAVLNALSLQSTTSV